jgi:hypothetical protein
MRSFWIAVKYVTAMLTIIGIYGFSYSIFEATKNAAQYPQEMFSFLVGGLTFIILWFIYLSKKDNFWSILAHELTHALFALIFFKKIHNISATRRRGGQIAIEGGNVFIALAPYFFPLASMALVVLKLVTPDRFQIILNYFLGITSASYVFHLLRELHTNQTDLQLAGLFFSTIFIIFGNILSWGILISSLTGDWNPISQFLMNGFENSMNYLSKILDELRNQFSFMVNGP